MLALQGMADEMEHEKARQRTYDAMQRKAQAGHVTGGKTFGYDNARTAEGQVVRVVNEQVRQQDRPESEWLRRDVPELRIVDEALWQAAHARLAESRALYLRGTNGRVWGHPTRGTESKYLLVGLARCGVCGSGVSVRSRSHGSRRAYYCVCTGYHLRGQHVCSNRYELPMDDTNAAVLGAIGKQVLSPDVLQAAIDRAVERLTTSRHDGDEAERLGADRRTIEEELSRLTAALASARACRRCWQPSASARRAVTPSSRDSAR